MARVPIPTFDTDYVELSTWITVPEAAEVLERTTARVRQMIDAGNFKTVATVGDRPLYLLDAKDVERVAEWERQRVAKRDAHK